MNGFAFVAALALVSVVVAPTLWAAKEEISLDDAVIRFEVNSTDGDAGLQLFLDGDAWDEITLIDPDGRKIFDVKATGELGALGLTELFFESDEPSFDDVSLEEILALFPEGEYQLVGKTVEGDLLVGTAELTHAIPDGPVIISPAPGGPLDPSNTVIAWLPVPDPPGSEIVGYQVVVEQEGPTERVFSVDLSAAATMVSVPPQFFEAGGEYKVEVLAIEAGGNQTISERELGTVE